MMLLITSSATSFLVLPVLLPGAEIMLLQEKKPFCSETTEGFLHGFVQNHGSVQVASGISNVLSAAPQEYANLCH